MQRPFTATASEASAVASLSPPENYRMAANAKPLARRPNAPACRTLVRRLTPRQTRQHIATVADVTTFENAGELI